MADSNPSASSWKEAVPCVMWGFFTSAFLVFLALTESAVSSSGAAIVTAAVWVIHALISFIAMAFTVSTSFLAFVFLGMLLSSLCLAFKYRGPEKNPFDTLTTTFVMLGLLGVCFLLISLAERSGNRIYAFSGPMTEEVADYDAMTVDEIVRARDSQKLFWRQYKFSERMTRGTVESYFGLPNCRRVVSGYKTSPAAHFYLMKVNDTVVEANTPVSVCTALKMSKIELTKLN